MHILVTNDDGYSEGLKMLLDVASGFGDAYAIIPNRQRSAISGAITLHKPIRIEKIREDIYEINGTPSDCVLIGLYSEKFQKPDLVLSGINWGDNAGISPITGSGTIGACWQAALDGVPAIGFSKYATHRVTHTDWKTGKAWGDREMIKKRVTEIIAMLKEKLDSESFFSVNLPEDLVSAKIVHAKKLQRKRFETKIIEKHDPYDQPYYWIKGISREPDKGSDLYEIQKNKNITITKISLDRLDAEG